MPKLSVKKPYTVIVGIILAIVLGYIAFGHMSTDLLPSMNLPYVVVYTPYPGATPERVETDVTRPMESAFATLTDLKKLTSQSQDNVSVVIMQFNDGANMDTALIEISAQLDQLKGTWDDDVGAPVAMKLNPDMLPVAILSVTRDDMDILALSDYVNDELIPGFEALNGVASATGNGLIEQEVDVTIEQSRIDVINSAILRDIDKELAKVEDQLNEAQAQISDGRNQLARAREEAYDQINAAATQIAQGEAAIEPAIQELTTQQEALTTQREELAQGIAAMEAALNMTDEEKAQVQAAAQQLAALKQQRESLQTLLEAAQNSADGDALAARRADAQRQRADLTAQRDALNTYLEDLDQMDADQLKADIDQLNRDIAGAEADLSAKQAALAQAEAQRDALKDRVAALKNQIDAASQSSGGSASGDDHNTASPTDGATTAPADGTTTSPTDEATTSPTDETTTAPTDGATTAPTDGATTAPADETTQAPGDDATKAPEGSGSSGGASEGQSEDQATEANGEKTSESGAEKTSESGAEKTQESASEKTSESASEKASESGSEKTSESGSEKVSESGSSKASESGAGSASESSSASAAEAQVLARPGQALAEEADVASLKAELATAEAALQSAEAEVRAKTAQVTQAQSTLSALQAQLTQKQRALEAAQDANANLTTRREEAQEDIAALEARIAALDQEIAEIDAQLAGSQAEAQALEAQIAALDEQIAAMEATGIEEAAELISDPEGLSAQYAQAQTGLAELDAGLEQMSTVMEKLKQGVIPAGFVEGVTEDTDLAAAKDQLNASVTEMEEMFSQASAMLSKASKELAKARKEFMDKRDEAYEDAGIDGVITVQLVAQILGAQNLSMPAGYADKADGDQVLVRVGNKFSSIDEMKHLKLFSLDLDTIDDVYLMDVADVQLADDREDVFTKLDGRDGILLSLEKQSTYSTADVAKTVLNYAEELQKAHPELHIVDLMNQGEYIDIVVNSVLQNLLSGGALAILVLLLFLLDWRPTLTVAFSIPISVVIAFVCMYFTGITLNVLSLSGLSLGIGMLVDNSIVSIENIYRLHDEEGYPLLKACVEGVGSVAGALIASTLTTICVFLPIVFVEGIARDLFQDMGLTIAYSLLASLLVAMTVVPMMCSYLMRRSKPKKHRIFSRIQAAYGAMLKGALRFKPLVLLSAVALLAFSGYQVTRMGISFMPEVNSRQMEASLEPDKDMTDKEQKAQAARIMDEILKLKGIQSVGLMQGSGTMIATGDGFSYYIIVDETAGVKNVELARQIDEIGEKLGADLTAQASTMDISMLTGDGIQVEITGDDIDTLQALARDIAQLARQTEGTADVDDGLEDAVPEMRLIVDKNKASEESLTEGQVYQFIAQKLLDKTEVGKITLDDKEMKIQLIEGRNQDIRPEDIQDLEIEVEREDEDEFIRIGDIVTIEDGQSLSTIARTSQRRMVAVSFQVAEGYASNHVSDAFAQKLSEYQLPAGYHAELTGENETVMDIMDDLITMIEVAVLFIFLIMVAQFQSFKSPIIVMFTIPLAFTGGLLALLLTGMDLSIVAMLGFLVLSGVVVNNGIVFIDCVNQLRIGGMGKKEALVEAGRQRLRPILMTALTTILGMSTMALGHGTGAEMMQPMAVVSIGGLTYATLMTLFVVPVLYDMFNGERMKAREIQMIREAAGMNGDELLEDPASPVPAAPVRSKPEEKPEPKPEPEPEPKPEPEPEPKPQPAPAQPPAQDIPPVPVFAARPMKKPIRVHLK